MRLGRLGRRCFLPTGLGLCLFLAWTGGGPLGEGRGVARAAEADNPGNPAAAEHQPAGEAGEAGEHHAPTLHAKSLALQLLNFAVLVAILIKFGGGAINKALQARHEQLKADLAAAAAGRAEAEARLKKQEQRLAGLEREIAGMLSGIKQEAEVEKARLIAAAEERARRLREEAAFVIDQQVKEAAASLRREAADGAIRVAEEILRRSINPGDQQRLLDGFINDVSDGAPAAAPAVVGKAV
jgi:F-type H+-transporting ATPase subunit b